MNKEKTTYFLDSTTLIHAIDKEAEYQKECLNIINKAAKGLINAASSLETLEETLFLLSRLISNRDALRVVRNLMLLPGLSKHVMGYPTLMQAMEVMEIYPIRPKDAINIATMLEKNIRFIISEDKDYDKIDLVQRINPRDLANL